MFRNQVVNTLILLVVTSTAYGMQKPMRWRGRAIPLAYDANTKEWSVLLSHKIGDPANLFTDFAQESEAGAGQRGNMVATQALKNQTNNMFDIRIMTHHPYLQYGQDWFHFVPVKFISGRELYDKARNNVKDDFMWIRADDIIRDREIKHPRRGGITVSNAVKAVLQNNLAKIIAQLDQQNTNTPSAPTAPPSASTQPVTQYKMPAAGWLTIPGAVLFYDSNKPYYEFTNFYPAAVNLDSKIWPTTEHYFQAQKFTDDNLQDKIRNLPTKAAFDEGNKRSNPLRPDWEAEKVGIMEKAVRAKFNQRPDLKKLLISTGSKTIVENAGANDSLWGAGADGKGQNLLGRILMHIRDELTGKIAANTPFTP
jgi:ribA/ribD-fused uncharacterized protein